MSTNTYKYQRFLTNVLNCDQLLKNLKTCLQTLTNANKSVEQQTRLKINLISKTIIVKLVKKC